MNRDLQGISAFKATVNMIKKDPWNIGNNL